MGGTLAGELVPVSHAGCWALSGLLITTGSLSMVGRGAVTGAGVGTGGGYFPKEERTQGLDCCELVGRGFLYSFDCRGEACSGVKDPVGGRDLGDQDGMVIEPEGVGGALATGVGHQHPDAAVVGEWERYQALAVWYPHVLRRLGFMWTRTAVPRGAMGVASKEKEPSRVSWAERRVF